MAGVLDVQELRNKNIKLVKVTPDNFYKLLKLSVTKRQEDFVAPNALSMSEAFAYASNGRFVECFGVYDGETPVGFVMIDHDTDEGDESYDIWRLMIDQQYQGRGFGHDAMKLILDYILTFPDGQEDAIYLSYEPENIVAKNLYASFGFVPTGEYNEGEEVAVLKLR